MKTTKNALKICFFKIDKRIYVTGLKFLYTEIACRVTFRNNSPGIPC